MQCQRTIETRDSRAKDRQLQELATYSQHVEMLYGEIRAFRHDYLNILTSLKLSIEHEDLNTSGNL